MGAVFSRMAGGRIDAIGKNVRNAKRIGKEAGVGDVRRASVYGTVPGHVRSAGKSRPWNR